MGARARDQTDRHVYVRAQGCMQLDAVPKGQEDRVHSIRWGGGRGWVDAEELVVVHRKFWSALLMQNQEFLAM